MNFFYLFFIFYILLGIFCSSATGLPCDDGFIEENALPGEMRTRISSRELILPKKPQKEESLSQKGYSPFWTRGLNEVNEWLAVKEQLTQLKANPRITHIDYFAGKIPEHLEYIKRSLTSLPKASKRQLALEGLERKAQEAITKKQVTYEWWIKFNYILSKILSPSYRELLDGKISEDEASMLMDSLINLFPRRILMPTIRGGLGIMTFNRTHPLNIHPMGLIRTDRTTHNRPVSPEGFFLHDMGHANRTDHFNSPVHKKFHSLFIERIEGLPIEKRQNVELIYFVLIHELYVDFIAHPSHITQLDPTINIYYRDFSDFINLPDSYRQVRQQVRQAIHDFKEIFSQIMEEITE